MKRTSNTCVRVFIFLRLGVFLLSKGRYIVYTDTRKLFFSVHIIPQIQYASDVRDGCIDVLEKKLKSLHRSVVKLFFPDTSLTTDRQSKQKSRKKKEITIMSLQKQL